VNKHSVIKGRRTREAALRMSPELLAELVHRLTDRDRRVLELVWEHRVLTTHQLTAICFGNSSKARHRLLALYRLRALERFQPWTPVGSMPWHWVLGPAGAYVLAAQRGIELHELGYRLTAALNVCHSRQLGHQVGVNEFFARLHLHANRLRNGSAVTEWWPERRCAALWGDLVRPDAYGRWTEPRRDGTLRELDFFLEHDTGSETLNRVAGKLAGYGALAEATEISTPVLLWLPSTAREANLRKVLGVPEVPVATAVQTASTDLEGPAGRAWLPAGAPGPRMRLIELADAWPELVSRPDSAQSRGILLLIAVMIGSLAGTLSSQQQASPLCGPGAVRSGAKVADIPPGYLALYVRAGATYGIPWPVLAAVGDMESDHGRSREPGVRSGENSAGAGGPMQFLSGTWNSFGVDGNHDGRKNRYDPADAIPAAARYLKHNGAPRKMRTALYRYNHSWDYVDDVLARAHDYQQSQDPRVLAQQSTANPDCDPSLSSIAVPNEVIGKIITFAMAQRGKRYVWGAEGPNAWDCSSLVQAAYRAAGYSIPRSTFDQWPFGVRVPKGTEQPGDLVFFNSGPGTSSNRPGHVGLVIAPGKMVAARCSTCRPNIGVQSYKRGDWLGTTRPLLRLTRHR
jgi:cell wall-associated NlpC family hydrolase